VKGCGLRDWLEGRGSASGDAGGSSAIVAALGSHQGTLPNHKGDDSCLIKK